MANTNRAVARIDLGILEHNYRTIKAKVSPEVGVLCVVKADAYGHGAVQVSRCLESLGAFYLGVATIDEAVELRINKVKCPILVMSGIMPWDDIATLHSHDLEPVVYDLATLGKIASMARSFRTPLKIHLKFDTGMGRLGFMADEAMKVVDFVEGIENIRIQGLMSHFSSSELRDDFGLFQVKSFGEVVDSLAKRDIKPATIHMANSAAITNYPEAHFTMVRTGISLYGSHSSHELKKDLPTRPVMKFVSKVALIREFPTGFSLSYGRTYVTERKTRVAYVPVGYADGYPRALSNKGSVLIRERRCAVIGKICMDWFLVDVTDHAEAVPGDEVILVGEGLRSAITADEVGELAGTIPYEILCKISKRVTRVYT